MREKQLISHCRVAYSRPFCRLLALALWLPFLALAQTLTITNGVRTFNALTNTTVTMTGRCELRITAGSNPIPGCIIHLNSSDAWFFLPNIRPSTAAASYLGQIRVNGAGAVADSNCRVVAYGMGAVVVPHAPSFQPLQVFSGPHFTGASASLGQYVYYRSSLGAMYAQISSFKLKRGYMATFAQNENGTGISKCYVAQDGDMEVSILPAGFDDSVRFVYVLPWRWTSKKGIAGNIESGLNVQWKYNWNIDQNSTRDLEYVPIRQTRWWPGLSQDWQTRGANHLLGYNEPDRPDQANMTVGDAIWSWPDLLGTGLRLGAPAVSDGGRSGWLYPFMAQADAANLRVDFVPVHYYWCFNPADPAGAANQMYNFLKATHDQVKRPLWITEWNNGANWTGCGDPTFAQQQAAITAMIEMLDNTPFVERYALYNWVEDVRRVKWNDGSLTAAGVTYRDKVSPIGHVQSLPDNGTRSFTQLRFENDTLDSSGYGNNGITSGSPAYTNGHRGQALVFDGANTVVTLPPNVAKNNAFTFAAWVYWNGGANWQRLFDFGNSTTHYMFLTPSATGGNLRFAIRNGGGEQLVQTSALAQNQWQHVAVTLNGNTARLYVNGTLAASNTGMTINPASFSPRANFLGKSQFVADPRFNGLMDEVLITDYALSAAQIAGLLNNAPPQFTSSIFTRGPAAEGQAYAGTIAGTATDADPGDTLTYSKTSGPAWLNVAASGALTGTPTSADGGMNYFTVRATDPAGQNGFALLTINVTVLTGSGAWITDANGNWSETNRWSGNFAAAGSGQTADFSTINITANRTVTLDASRSIGTLRFGDTSGGQAWTVVADEGRSLTLDSGSSQMPAIHATTPTTLATPLAGTNGFAKTGASTLILAGNNPLSGAVNIDTSSTTASEGAVRAAHSGALANVNLIRIRNNNSGSSTLQLDGSSGGVHVPANIALNGRNNAVPAIQNLAGDNTLAGDVSIGVGGSNYGIQSDAGQLALSGNISSAATGTRTFTFQGNGDCAVIGVIANGSAATFNVIKTGAGRLTLAGENTYNGTTTVGGGTLLVNGAIGAGGLTLAAGATLGGYGSIAGPVTVPASATMSPGDGIGRLTVNNNAALQASSVTRMEISAAGVTNDQLRATGMLTFGGALVVTNVAGTLGAGEAFTLFQAATFNGNFSSVSLPPLSPGLAWDTSSLSSGILSVVSILPGTPTNLAFSVSGGNLTLEWPANYTGWILQAQTNQTGAGLSTNWFDLSDSAGTNLFIRPIGVDDSAVFFRLRYP